jgi:fructokinase
VSSFHILGVISEQVRVLSVNQLEELFAAAKDLGCLVVADAVIAPDGYREHLREAAPLIDVLHCNDHEAQWITGLTETEAAVEGLLDAGVTLPIVSQGARDLLVGYNGYRYSVPAFKVVCTDPTGAGDALTAGLVKKLLELEGASVEEKLGGSETNLFEAVLFGEAAGAVCVTALGCTPAVDPGNVFELLEGQSKDVLSGIVRSKL